jgi:large subunit ribosomal protein L33
LTPDARRITFQTQPITLMRDQVILECTEAAKEGKAPSRYFTTKNKKLQQERLEVLKYNPNLRRRTLHKEKK